MGRGSRGDGRLLHLSHKPARLLNLDAHRRHSAQHRSGDGYILVRLNRETALTVVLVEQNC